MKVEHFVLKIDETSGEKFFTFAEGITKTRGGGLRKKIRKTVPKMFETPLIPDRCPVRIFQFFLSKRPLEMRSSGPLYLALIKNPIWNVWFKTSNIGVNKIDTITKTMVAKSPLETTKHLTNHAWRKTLTKTLRKSGASRSEIIEITGHSNDRGLDPYDSGDEAQQRKMSHILDHYKPTPVQAATDVVAPPTSSTAFPCAPGPSHAQQMAPRMEEMTASTEFSTPPANVYNFYNCNVTLGQQSEQSSKQSVMKRRRVIMSSDESSQE